MQFFTPQGLRDINCSKCATQKRTKGWKCECGVAWHTCDIHRNDPSVHRSTKPQAAVKKTEELKEMSFKDSDRKAPDAVQSTTHRPQKKIRVAATLHMHEVANQVQEVDIRSRNLLERVKSKFAERDDRPQDRDSKARRIESRKEPTESKKSKADDTVNQGNSKKLKSDGKDQHDTQPIAMTRKRMREELEERIDDLRIQQARSNKDESEHRGTRRRKNDRKNECPDEATFEADPQLPRRKDGTQKILERFRNRSKGSRDKNSTRPCKSIHMHERDAITRLINGGGTSTSTDRLNTRGACGVGMPVSALA